MSNGRSHPCFIRFIHVIIFSGAELTRNLQRMEETKYREYIRDWNLELNGLGVESLPPLAV